MENKVVIKRDLTRSLFYFAPVEIIIPFTDQHRLVSRLLENIYSTVQTNKYIITLLDCGSKNKFFVKQLEKNKLPNIRTLQFPEKNSQISAINYALQNPYQEGINWICFVNPAVHFDKNNWLKNLGDTYCKLQSENVSLISPKKRDTKIDNNENKIVDEPIEFNCFLLWRGLFNTAGYFEESNLDLSHQIYKKIKSTKRTQALCGSSFFCN